MPQPMFGLRNDFFVVGKPLDEQALSGYHILPSEIQCHPDGKICPYCEGSGALYVGTAQTFAAIREKIGKPISILSGYRCVKHQDALYQAGLGRVRGLYPVLSDGALQAIVERTIAKPGSSPHNWAMALDLATPEGMTPLTFHGLVAGWFPELRIGLYPWGIHTDRCFEMDPNPDPTDYQRGVRWG